MRFTAFIIRISIPFTNTARLLSPHPDFSIPAAFRNLPLATMLSLLSAVPTVSAAAVAASSAIPASQNLPLASLLPTITSPTSPATPTPTTEYWCWLSADCLGMYRKVQDCYNSIGGLIDPNDASQAAAAQACICDAANPGKLEEEADFEACQGCFRGARTGEEVLEEWESNVAGFCVTKEPSFYLFLAQMLNFMAQAHTPMPFTQALTGPITVVTTLSDHFTPKSGLNNLPLSTKAHTTSSDSNTDTSAAPGASITPATTPSQASSASPQAPNQAMVVTSTQTLRYNPSLLPSIATDAWTAWFRPGRWAGQLQEPVTLMADDGRPMLVVQGPVDGDWRVRSGAERVGVWSYCVAGFVLGLLTVWLRG